MNYFDYAILGVMALFLIIGFCKGFIKTGLSIVSWGISLAIIYFLGNIIANWLMGTPIGGGLTSAFEPLFAKIGDFGALTVGQNAAGEYIVKESGELISSALAGQAIPGFIASIIAKNLTVDATVASGLAKSAATFTSYAIVSVVIVIIVSIIIGIISIVIHRVLRAKKLGAINRLIGAVLYVAVGICFVSIAMMIIDVMEPIPFMNQVIEMRNGGKISSLFADKNPLILIWNAIINK